jgi:alpha-tubulin suppressor-like RCC1 family protein
MISAGMAHSLALDVEGHVFGFGLNEVGEVGIGPDAPQQNTPVRAIIPNNVRVVHISCGNLLSLAVTEGNKLLSWGGTLGFGRVGGRYGEPGSSFGF